MLTETEPSSTRLINIPCYFLDKKYKLLIYTNDVKPKDKGALMVVPFPKRNGEIGLVDISTENMKDFRKLVFTECEKLKPEEPPSRSYGGILLCSNSMPKKEIYEIGNYNISVADNLNELLNNIDWSKFTKPNDFDERINIMKNKQIYQEDEYFYIVAECLKPIKNDGFGVVYPDCGYDYFPTAHEKLGIVNFDVKMYNFFDKKRHFVIYDGMYLRNYHLNHPIAINDMCKKLTTEMTLVSNGTIGNFEINMKPSCNYFEMREQHNNGNIMIDENDVDDSIIQPVYYREKINFEEKHEERKIPTISGFMPFQTYSNFDTL